MQNKELKVLAETLGFQKFLPASELKIKKGGALELNRKAVRTARILLDPVSPQDKAFDTAVAQIAKDNDVAIAFSVKSVIDAKGLDKVRILRNICFAVEICKKMKNNVMIVSNASDKFDSKDAVVLMAFGQLIGLSKTQAQWSISHSYDGFV